MTQERPIENPADRRSVERMPTTLRGKIFPGAVDCIVEDFSDLGACLHFEQEPAGGDRVILVMWSTGIAFDVEVRWRNGRQIGGKFVSRRDFRNPTPAIFHEARKLWRQSRPKIRRAYRAGRTPMLGAPS